MAVARSTQGTAGYSEKGVYGGVVSVTDNLLTDTAVLHPNRDGFKLQVKHFSSVADTNTWTSNIPNIIAVAWQPATAADDDVRPALTDQATGTVTFVAGGTRSGWLWFLRGL